MIVNDPYVARLTVFPLEQDAPLMNARSARQDVPAMCPGPAADRPAPPVSSFRAMDDRSILAGIAAVAAAHLGWEGPLAPDMRLVEDLRLDSIRLLTLAAEVENRFQVMLAEEDELGIETVGDLVAVVRRKLAAG